MYIHARVPHHVCAVVLFLAAAAASPAEQEQARALVRSAKEAFDAGDFATAADLLTKARALAPTPATLYNLGRALEKKGDLPGAEAAYREYLSLSPAAADRGAVEATIADLQRRIAEAKRLDDLERERQQRAAEVVAPAPPPPPPPKPLLPRVAPWVLAALGAGGLGAAIGFGITAQSRHAAAVATPDVDAAIATQAGAESFARVSTALYVTGAVVLGAALLWLVIAAVRSDDA